MAAISDELEKKDRMVKMTNGVYPWSSVTQIFIAVNQVMMETVKLSNL